MQRGAISLTVVMAMLLALVLAAAYSGRSLLVEQRTGTEQYRSTQAAQAADAGLDWALAQLNGDRVDDACLPSADPAMPTFAQRSLQPIGDDGAFALDPDPALAGTPACVSPAGVEWRCLCPAKGAARPAPDAGDVLQPSFQVHLAGAALEPGGAAMPGLLQLSAEGCAHIAATSPCSPGSGVDAAYARARVQAALLPALSGPPAATLTASGQAQVLDAAEIANTDPNTGLTVHAGLAAELGAARLAGPAGSGAMTSVLANDDPLAIQTFDTLMRSAVGMSAAAWSQAPAVRTVHCTDNCGALVEAAVSSGARLLWLPEGGTLSSLSLGSDQTPVLLAAGGPLRFEGAVHLVGVLLAPGWHWRGDGGWLRGAAVVAGDAVIEGKPLLDYDVAVLRALHTRIGNWVRLPGSWKDGP